MSAKEVCLVTPHAVQNFGALLQAYALGRHVSRLGYEVSFYDFPPHQKALSVKEKAISKVSALLKWWYRAKVIRKNAKFEEFYQRFKLTREKDLPCYIVGSDQVWHPNNLDNTFSLEFAAEKSLKFSYAASLGVQHIAAQHEAKFRQALKRLSFLSARELDGGNEVRRLTGRECGIHIDPTFLLSQEDWISIERPVAGMKEPFILLYLLYVPKDINPILKRLRERYSQKIYVIDIKCYLHFLAKGCKPLIDVGPCEFVWLFHHADLVVTSSFHGMAFSLIFGKPFLPLVNPAFPSRMANLFRLIQWNHDFRKPISQIEASVVRCPKDALSSEIAAGKDYLRNCLQHISST